MMSDYPWRIQIVYTAILSLLLLLVFLPITIGWKIIGILFILIIAVSLLLRVRRYRKFLSSATESIQFLTHKLALLPARQRYRLPILLVTGDAARDFFPEDLTLAESNIIISSEAVWIYVGEFSELPIVFDSLIARWPDMLGRVGLFLTVVPEIEDRQGLFVAKLQAFRQSWVDTCRLAKYRLPVYVSTHVGFNNLHYHDDAPLPVYWYQIVNHQLYLLDEYCTPLSNWSNNKQISTAEREQRLHMQYMLADHAFWIEENILSVLGDNRQPIAKCIPAATAIYPINSQRIDNNRLIKHWEKLTTLALPNTFSVQEVITPPDQLVKFMPIAYPFSAIWKCICNMLIITSVFAVACLSASYINNQKLIYQIQEDIHHYQLIAMDNYDVKAEALSVLKTDRSLLNKYFQEGEPVRLGLGLYRGQTLVEPLNVAISQYLPPPAPPPEPEKIVIKEKEIVFREPDVIRLDSLALFESGKSTLKSDSNRILINALMEINKQISDSQDSGWLILISGHTDSVGDPIKNQQLSIERATAVREWIIKTSDIPETCFAVQGYGAKKPLVSNDTPDERAKNRRVEISLVPQISKCLINEN